MREFRSVSPSQLYAHDDCKRLWWFQYVLGLETEQRASAAIGTATHAVCEDYLNEKPIPDTEAGRIFRPAASLLPPPGTVYTEVKIHDPESAYPRPDIDGLPVNGLVDVLDLVNEDKGYPRVVDLKTTSDLKYAKTEAELRVDHQGIIYGKFALGVVAQMGSPADRVRFEHVVTLTRGGPLAKRTGVTLAAEHIDARWRDVLVPAVREMRETAKVKLAEDVPGNRESCNKYGGCHFRDRCRALGMAVDGEVPSFIARLTGGGAFSGLTQPEPRAMSGVHTPAPSPPPEPPMSEAASSPVDPMAALRRLQAQRAAANGGAPATTPAATTPAATTPAATTPAATTGAQSILAKYGIKPKGGEGEPAAPPVVPGDAPPQVSSIAGNAPASAPATPPADGEAAKAPRKPPGFLPKLTALHWTPGQIEKMHPDAMRTAIDGKLDGREYSVRNDGTIFKPGGGPVASTPEADAPAWYFHPESDGFVSLTRAQWEGTAERGLLVEVGDDAAKAEAEAMLAADKRGETVAWKGAAKRIIDALVARATTGDMQERAAADAPIQARADAEQAAFAASRPDIYPAAPKLVLYIDCEPVKGRDKGYQILEELVAPLLPQAVEMHNRGAKKEEEKADFYTLIPYNRGPGYVATLLLRNPPTGVVVCSTRYPATNGCLEVLIPLADVVVRALR